MERKVMAELVSWKDKPNRMPLNLCTLGKPSGNGSVF